MMLRTGMKLGNDAIIAEMLEETKHEVTYQTMWRVRITGPTGMAVVLSPVARLMQFISDNKLTVAN